MLLVLASTSPRRKELLALLQRPFEVTAPDFHERLNPDLPPGEQAKLFARGKAHSCAREYVEDLVLGSDTLIAVGETILGKPADRAGAGAMLRRLRGRDHHIYTAVALCCAARNIQEVAMDTVRVWMRPFSDADLDAYLASDEWQDKAGAYSIQGRGGSLIERIEGDFTAAVGLPLRLTASLLQKHGLSLPVDVEQLYQTKPYPNWNVFQR
jgi:nucleoside triphosphate pyrophosphatase